MSTFLTKEVTKLEVGKTYIFKDESAKQNYIDSDIANYDIYTSYYNCGFTLGWVGSGGVIGRVGHSIVIDDAELIYFKEVVGEGQTFEQQLSDLLNTHEGLTVLREKHKGVTLEGLTAHLIKEMKHYVVDGSDYDIFSRGE